MKKKNRMKNKQIVGGCESEVAGEIVEGGVGNEMMDRKCSGEEEVNRMAEVELNRKFSGEGEIDRIAVVELNRKYSGEGEIDRMVEVELSKKCSGEGEINRMAEVELSKKCSGEGEINRMVEAELDQKCCGEEEINRMVEVELDQKCCGEGEINQMVEVELDQKCSGEEEINQNVEDKTEVELNGKSGGEVGDRKAEVGLNGKRSGEEQGDRKAELGVSEIRNLVEKNEGGGVGGVNEKREGGVEVNTVTRRKKRRRAKEAIKVEMKRRCMGKEESEMKGEVNEKREVDVIDKMDVEVGDQKQDVESTKVKEMKLLKKKHKRWLAREKARWLARQKARKLAEEANQNKQEEEKADKEQDGNEGESTNVEKKDVEAIIERVGGKAEEGDGDVKKEREIVVEKQEGEASGKHEERVAQEKEMKGELDEKHEVEVYDRMELDAGEERDLVEKDEDGGDVQMSVEEAVITRPDGLESDLKLQGKVHFHMQEGKAKLKQEEVNHKEGEATKLKKKNSKQLKQMLKVEKGHIEKQGGEGAVLEKPTGEKAVVGNQWRQFAQKIGEDSRAKLISALNQFSNSEDQEYTFDATLTKSERAAIHLLCRKMGMGAKSNGSGRKRCISVYKRRVSGKITRKDNITSFTLSKEAKDVSLNLFTQYPPYDCGSGDKMAGKFIGITNRRRKTDPFFARPLTSKFNIRRKVELLTFKLAKDPKLKQITEKRTKLPIAFFRHAITSAIDSHQVVLISGETGCGKTTQVPQYVLDHVWSKSETCKIVCTQPRRISAVSVAGRIASERGENIGDSVGYKIKMESEGGRNSSIIFCTTGVLIRVLVSMGSNRLGEESSGDRNAIAGPNGITHIIVDEVHERDQFSDLLLAIIRDLLPSNPKIRVVLMSATIDAERFSQYFGGCPVIKVPGFTYPVKTFYLEDILSILKSNENNHLESASRSASENFLLSEEYRAVIDEAITLAWSSDEYEPLLDLVSAEAGPSILNFQHSSTGVTPLMVFSRKGRVGELCMTLSLGADCYLQDNDGLTAHEWAKRENQKEAAEILKKHMEKIVMNNKEEECLLDKYLATVNSEVVDFVLIEKLLTKICTDSTDGAILVFLTGWDDIQKTIERLQRSSFFKDASKFLLLALHSKVPSLDQKKVFERAPPGCRKIVLSTNIAESSITIDDVVYVINSGRMKEKSYDPYIKVSTLLSSWISKASAKQRAGRAGRCRPGICYHLYSKIREASFLDFQVPEVKRMPLEELCLQVKILDPVCKIDEFLGKLLDPPATQSISNAISVLQELGALSPDEELTELGNKLASLPVHPVLSKMLFFAILLNCLDPALTLACVSSYRDPFYNPMDPTEKKKAISARLELASLYGGHGDQLAVIAAFECWKIAVEKGEGAIFCSRYFLSSGTMKMVSRMRMKLLSELHRKGFIPKDGPCCNLNAHDPGIRNAVLLAGFYPMVGRLSLPKRGQRAVVETAGGVKVHLTSSSANYMSSSDDSEPLVIFDEIVRGDGGLLIKNCSIIGPLPLLLLAKEIIVTPYEEVKDKKGHIESDDDYEVHKHKDSPIEGQTIMSCPGNKVKVVVDRWLTFESTALDVAQICCLRERLSAAALFKIRSPFGTQSKISDASINSIARILSCDGLSGIPSALKYKSPQALETSATEAGQSEPVRERVTSNADSYLTSLMQQYHAKNYALDDVGKASIGAKRDNPNQPAYCNQQPPPPPVEMTNRLPKWI